MTFPAPAQPNEIHAIPYNRANAALRRAIALLQYRASPTAGSPPSDPIEPEHDPVLEALSFYLLDDSRLVSYAAVVHKQIKHGDATLWIAGLSCVATDPDYQGRGLGTRVVGAASRYIEQSTIDMGIFTCDPPLTRFYACAGAWPVAPNIVLIGGQYDGALTSVALRKAVLMRLFSAKAQAMAAQLCRATIDLNLPAGQFL
jgi:GNAT superfamily N-acetyltransferase